MNDRTSPVFLALPSQHEMDAKTEVPTSPATAHTPTAAIPQLRLHAPQPGSPPDCDETESSHDEAATIVDGLLKAAHRLRGVLSHHFAEFDLSDVRYTVLRMLADSEPEGCTQADVAVHLDQSESSISMLIKRMRNSELLFRLRSIDDKRKWVLKLTNRGRELLQNVQDCHARRMGELLGQFTAAERESFSAQLQKLLSVLATSPLIGSDTRTDEPATRIVSLPAPRSDASPAA